MAVCGYFDNKANHLLDLVQCDNKVEIAILPAILSDQRESYGIVSKLCVSTTQNKANENIM